MELSIYASNTDQMYQILEQILILFDYDLQVQFNDALAISRDLVKQISLDAIKIGVKPQQMVATFRSSLEPRTTSWNEYITN